MSFVFPTNVTQVQAFAGALFGVQCGTDTIAQVNTDILANGGLAKTLNGYYSATQSSTAATAATVATNLGLTGTALAEGTAYITSQLNAVAGDARGAVISNIANMFGKYTTDSIFGAAAAAWNTKVAAAVAYTGATNVAIGTANPAATVTGSIFALSAGVDIGVIGTAGDDTFSGTTSAGALTFTSLDSIDGGAGNNDTLSIAATVAVDTTAAVGATVKNIEKVLIASTGAVTANTTAWTGVTSLSTTSTGNSTLTAVATTDVTATVGAPTGAGAAVINGGKAVTLGVTDTSAADTATGNTVTVGVTTAAAGAVTITQSETHAASANAGASALATGTIRVDGGTTVTVNSLASVAAGDNAGDVVTIGQVTVNGKGTATSVSVTQSPATATYATAGNLYKIANGVVTITDNNTATKADSITSVSLANFGASTVRGNALTTLNLTGGTTIASETVTISQSASLLTAAPTTLAINMTSGRVGVITDTNDQYTTLNVDSAAAATIAGLDFTNATALNVSGAGVTTISAQTDLAKVTAITSTGGGLALTGTLAVGTSFTGGAGKDSVDVGATTKAITTGAGDDVITISASALGALGSVDAGEGTADTLSMTAANAVTASATTTFETKISGFERLSLGNVAASGTVALANLDDLNDVAVAGVAAGQALTLSGANSGINLRFADAVQTSTIVTLANNGSADVANVFLTTADEASTHSAIDLTGFETLNIASADTDTNAVAASNAITGLTAPDATTVVVTGNAGLALAAGFNGALKVTSFNASAVTAGAVTYTTGALAAAATISGGAGNDTLSGAAAAIAGVTINGGAGNDIITGSATKASTLNGDAGNDTITGGAAADVLDGGAGTNTYVFSSANVVEQAGSGTTSGAAINLGAEALTFSAVNAAVTGAFLANTQTSLASGTSTYLFNNESSTNASVVDTITNFQHVTGTDLADFIVGSAADNIITGGAGADVMQGGEGNDVFIIIGSGQAVNANAAIDLINGGAGTADELRLSTATTIAGTDILTRITNVEKITSDANAGVVSITITAASWAGTAFTAIDLSGDTDATSNNVISVSGVTTISTITGSAGIDAITHGANAIAATLKGGLGVDTYTLGATLAATVVIGTLDTGASVATADVITGFNTTVDKLSLGVAGTAGNFATANGAADEAAAIAAANTAMNGTVKYYLATAIVADLGAGANASSLLYIDADMDGTLDDVIQVVGTAGVVVAADIIA